MGLVESAYRFGSFRKKISSVSFGTEILSLGHLTVSHNPGDTTGKDKEGCPNHSHVDSSVSSWKTL